MKVLVLVLCVCLLATPVLAEEPIHTCLGHVATIVGTEDDDEITAPNQTGDVKNVIVALGGDDVIYGGNRRDIICAGEGNDVVSGGGGENRLVGGSGDDTFFTRSFDMLHFDDAPGPIEFIENAAVGEGMDRVVGDFMGVAGSEFDDRIQLSGSSIVLAGGGDDLIDLQRSDGYDHLYGGPGDDEIYGGGGADRLFGGAGRDLIKGGTGADTLFGLNGHDLLIGGRGHDDIFGGDGSDYLNGSYGFDKIDGGRGSDRCVNGERVGRCRMETPP